MPIARSHVADGLQEHQEIKESLARLDGRVGSAHVKDVSDQVKTLEKKTAHHIDEEERELFPAIAMVARKSELDDLGRAMQRAKGTAPTRPHPKQPAVNEFTMRANGIVDRARDAVAGRKR
ncbi:MAG: hemerythrin domain-containing protein [Candidatus Dormibacteraeota bacterium]|nr:hemerythrin domain-containing protein [Candidatus Dormibacteraeota bacterium]